MNNGTYLKCLQVINFSLQHVQILPESPQALLVLIVGNALLLADLAFYHLNVILVQFHQLI